MDIHKIVRPPPHGRAELARGGSGNRFHESLNGMVRSVYSGWPAGARVAGAQVAGRCDWPRATRPASANVGRPAGLSPLVGPDIVTRPDASDSAIEPDFVREPSRNHLVPVVTRRFHLQKR